ncbi:MAG: aminofutalosine synthase MqnE, partial [Campylobacter sp.]|nr:aminofutalosine synthase MqnE [Campylobacter sp.]
MLELIEKLENQVRLNFDEAVKLWDLDLFELAKFANLIREQKNGKKVYFNSNRHINPSNFCADTCKFCAFSAHRKNEKQSY